MLGRTTAARKWAILSVLAVLSSASTPARNEKSGAWQQFKYVARNIVVRCILAGRVGARVEADFIIDTGLNRTTINSPFAQKLGLLGNAKTRAHSPTGTKLEPVMDLPSLRVGNKEKTHLQVAVDDLSRFSAEYRHNVDGFVGTDFLAHLILSLDLQNQLFSLDPNAKLDGAVLLDLNATPFSGLLLVPVTLPNRLTMLVIIDTGADHPTDFMFYDDALSGITFHGVSASESGHQTTAPEPVVHGTIESIRLGDVEIPQPSVTRLPTSNENPYGTRYRPGLLTCQFFEHYYAQIDFPLHRLRLNASPAK